MQVSELLQLAEWFQDNVVSAEIPDKYTALFTKLQHNSQRAGQILPFEDERIALNQTLNSMRFDSLSLEQIQLLEKLEIYDLLSTSGIKQIEVILHDNQLDILTAANKIEAFTKRIDKAVSKFDNIYSSLIDYFSSEKDDEITENEILIRVYFKDRSAINNLSDLKKLSNSWYDIGRGIAMANSRSPEDFKIIGAQKGSVIIDLAVAAGIATTVSSILLKGLKVADRYIEVLKKVQELKNLKLNNKKIELELLKEAESEKEAGAKVILDLMIAELKLNPESDGDKITALNKSIIKFIEFTKNGGVVDLVQPKDNDNDSEDNATKPLRKELQSLKKNMAEIRSLESKIKLLEQ